MLNDVVVWDSNDECISILDQPAQWAYGDRLDERMDISFDGSVPEWYNFAGGFNIMQYTGIKDKKGVRVFEGDIVAAKLRNKGTIQIGSIEMPKSCWVLQFKTDDGKVRWNRTAEFSEFEIIGNVYQNPELL